MSLIITENNGTFFLNGNINAETSKLLKNHLESLLDQKNQITINLEAVTHINYNGVVVLKSIYNTALQQNVTLLIAGKGHKEINGVFGYNKSA
ncbi:STAS domain-containing protein [uncultured Winogradskyella sp.]|uniref:STAS domain-containing protein n=1 Tax=uncultured Winogradskyella sp. TaxID=395353 RepID=UPI0030D7C78A|tara:strand:- start:1757 stop:2035 length:279 start_codon:yes stop_codon:yes gene_type:complete